jgi:L-rhamnose mutarotase
MKQVSTPVIAVGMCLALGAGELAEEMILRKDAAVWALLSAFLCAAGMRETDEGDRRKGYLLGISNPGAATLQEFANAHVGALRNLDGTEGVRFYLAQLDELHFCLFAYLEQTGAADRVPAGRFDGEDPFEGSGNRGDGPSLPGEGGSWIEMEEVFHFDGERTPPPGGRRRSLASVLGIENRDIPAYVKLHQAVWPGVLKTINDGNIRNFSIYLGEVGDGRYFLFSHYDYVGEDYEADMKRIARDQVTRTWLTHTEPLQRPLPTRREGEWWHLMEELNSVS